MAALGRLFVSLGLDSAEFTGGLSKAEHQLNKFVNQTSVRIGAISGIVAAGMGAAVTQIARSIVDAADKLQDFSERTGESVETLVGLSYAFTQAGASSEDLEKGLNKLSKAISEAGTGNKDFQQLFKDLGMDEAARGAGTATEALLKLADVFPKLSQVDKDRVMGDLLSKTQALIPALNGGSAALRSMIEEGQRLNPITGDLAKQANEFNDTMVKIGVAIKGSLLPALEAALPVLQGMANEFLNAKKSGLGFFDYFADIALSSKTAAQGIADYTKKIAQLSEQRDKSNRPSDIDHLGKEIERNKKFLAHFKLQQQDEALAFGKGVQSMEGRGLMGPSAAAIKLTPRDDAKKEIDNLLRKQLEGRLKAIQNANDREQQTLDAQSDFLSRFYADNLLSSAEYYDQRQRIVQDGLRSEVASIDKQVEALRAAQAKLGKDTNQADTENKIADLIAKRAQIEFGAAKQSNILFLDQEKAARDYKRELGSLNAQVLELQGSLSAAAVIRFDQQNEGLRNKFSAAGDTEAIASLDRLQRFAKSQGDINELTQQAQILQDQLTNTEARLGLQQEANSISELGAMMKAGEARAASAAKLQAIADQYQAIALASGNPKLIQDADNFKTHIEQMAAAADVVGKKFKDMFEGGFGDAFASIIDGTKSVKDAFSDMVGNIGKQLAQLAAQQIAKDLFKSISGGGTSGGGGGDWLGTIFKLFGGLAGGGPAFPNSINQVNENGPELLNVGGKSYLMMGSQGGNVSPLRGGAPMTVINHINVPQDTSRATASQVASATGNAVARAQRRNG